MLVFNLFCVVVFGWACQRQFLFRGIPAVADTGFVVPAVHVFIANHTHHPHKQLRRGDLSVFAVREALSFVQSHFVWPILTLRDDVGIYSEVRDSIDLRSVGREVRGRTFSNPYTESANTGWRLAVVDYGVLQSAGKCPRPHLIEINPDVAREIESFDEQPRPFYVYLGVRTLFSRVCCHHSGFGLLSDFPKSFNTYETSDKGRETTNPNRKNIRLESLMEIGFVIIFLTGWTVLCCRCAGLWPEHKDE